MNPPGPSASDADLVAGVLAGDRTAFAGVYERYADRLWDFAFSMLRNREEASDCVADSFVVMAEKVGQLRDPSRLRPWLYAVVRNECLRTLRGRAREAHDDEWLEAMPDQAAGPEEQVAREDLQDELRELVWAAVEGLNDRDRVLIDLHLRQGLEGSDLAVAMDVTPSNAYVMLSRARDQVERSLGALLIARRGSDACSELAGVLRDWDGRFSPLVRKRVARHIDGCDVCETSRKLMVSPLALLAGVPAFAAPAGLRDRVLGDERLVGYYVDGAGGAGGLGAADRSRDRRRGVLANLLVLLLVVLLVLGAGLAVVLWPDGARDLAAVDTPSGTTPAAPPSTPTATPSTTPSAAPSTAGTTVTEPSGSTSSATTATTDVTVAAPAELAASTRTLRLGSRDSAGTVRLTNTGGTALTFDADPRAGWLSASPGGGRLAPGASTALRISADRSGLSEGSHSGQVVVSSDGGDVAITVTLTVDRPPVIGTISATGDSCSVPVSATVSDGSGVRAVQVTWSGAVSGRAAAQRSGSSWTASVEPISLGGQVTVTFTATDTTGLRSSRSRTFTFNPCPG
ncbi:MAG TPA: sigma-70 family RNA polymerase sigma factor [Nocardioides sp.]|nr:sigma-70 family RNA polymerase sigma factor [Nocardioides sp.]